MYILRYKYKEKQIKQDMRLIKPKNQIYSILFTVIFCSLAMISTSYAFRSYLDKNDPTLIVNEFYSYCLRNKEKALVKEDFIKSKLLTDSFKKAINQKYSKINTNEDTIDPITFSYQKPNFFEAKLLNQNDKEATVIVKEFFFDQNKELKVSLILINNDWRINNIEENTTIYKIDNKNELLLKYLSKNLFNYVDIDKDNIQINNINIISDNLAIVEYTNNNINYFAKIIYKVTKTPWNEDITVYSFDVLK